MPHPAPQMGSQEAKLLLGRRVGEVARDPSRVQVGGLGLPGGAVPVPWTAVAQPGVQQRGRLPSQVPPALGGRWPEAEGPSRGSLLLTATRPAPPLLQGPTHWISGF